MDIKTLISKKNWAGRDLGILFLTDCMMQIGQANRGEKIKPLFTENQFDIMRKNLRNNDADVDCYNGYIHAFNWYKGHSNMAQIRYQYAQSQFRVLEAFLHQAILAEDTHRYISMLPTIMTEKQYQELKDDALTKHMTYDDGTPIEDTILNLVDEALQYYYKLYEKDQRKANPLKKIKDIYLKENISLPTWIEYFDKLTDKSKWSVLTSQDGLAGDLFPMYEEDLFLEGSEDEYLNDVEELVTEYGELINLLLEDVDKKYPGIIGKGIKVSSIPWREWYNTRVTRRSLYDADFYGVRAFYDEDSMIFDGDKKSFDNGIAILKPIRICDSIEPSCNRIDKDGNYVAPLAGLFERILPYSLEALFTEHEDYAINIRLISQARAGLLDGYYFAKAFEKAIELGAEILNVPQLKEIAAGISSNALEQRIEGFNELAEELTNIINQYHDESDALAKRKLEVIKDMFPPIKIKDTNLTAKKIDKIKVMMESLSCFKNTNQKDLIEYLGYTSGDQS